MTLLTRLRARLRAEEGNAVVEFVFLGVLMLIPLVYLVLVLARIQAGTYAVSAAAREAGRAFVTSPVEGQAAVRAQAAARIAFEDQGFGDIGTISLSCNGSPCLRPEGRVEVTARVSVPLPLVPDFLGGVVPMAVPIEAGHLAVVDRFRGLG